MLGWHKYITRVMGARGARAGRWLIQFIKIINVINKVSRSRLFLRQYCSSKGAFICFLDDM